LIKIMTKLWVNFANSEWVINYFIVIHEI
jgi:hypothetical protein